MSSQESCHKENWVKKISLWEMKRKKWKKIRFFTEIVVLLLSITLIASVAVSYILLSINFYFSLALLAFSTIILRSIAVFVQTYRQIQDPLRDVPADIVSWIAFQLSTWKLHRGLWLICSIALISILLIFIPFTMDIAQILTNYVQLEPNVKVSDAVMIIFTLSTSIY